MHFGRVLREPVFVDDATRITFSKHVRTPSELNVSGIKCGGKPRDLRYVYLHLAGRLRKEGKNTEYGKFRRAFYNVC